MDPQSTKLRNLHAASSKLPPVAGKPPRKSEGVEQIHPSTDLTGDIKTNASKAKSPSNAVEKDFARILRIVSLDRNLSLSERTALPTATSDQLNARLKRLAGEDTASPMNRLEAIELIDNIDTQRDALIEFLRNCTLTHHTFLYNGPLLPNKLNEVLNKLYGDINDVEEKRNTYKALVKYVRKIDTQLWLAKNIQDPDAKYSVTQAIIEPLLKTGKIEPSIFSKLIDMMNDGHALKSQLQECFIKGELEIFSQNPKQYINEHKNDYNKKWVMQYIFENRIDDPKQDQLAIQQVYNQALPLEDRLFFIKYIKNTQYFYSSFKNIQEAIKSSDLMQLYKDWSLKLLDQALLERESKRLKDNPKIGSEIQNIMKLLQDPACLIKKELFELLPPGPTRLVIDRTILKSPQGHSLMNDRDSALSIAPLLVQKIEKFTMDRKENEAKVKKELVLNVCNLDWMYPEVKFCMLKNVTDASLKEEMIRIIKSRNHLIEILNCIQKKDIEALEKIIPLNKENIQGYLENYLLNPNLENPSSVDKYKHIMEQYGHFFSADDKDEYCWNFFFGQKKNIYINKGGKFDKSVYALHKHKMNILSFMSDRALKELLNRTYTPTDQIEHHGDFYIGILNAFRNDSPALEDILNREKEEHLVAIGKCPELDQRVYGKIVSRLKNPKNIAEVQKKYLRNRANFWLS